MNCITTAAHRVREEVRSVIEEALEFRADRISVNIEDSVLTLTGVVHSWAAKRAILGAVGHTPGVSAVRDHLRIEAQWAVV